MIVKTLLSLRINKFGISKNDQVICDVLWKLLKCLRSYADTVLLQPMLYITLDKPSLLRLRVVHSYIWINMLDKP